MENTEDTVKLKCLHLAEDEKAEDALEIVGDGEEFAVLIYTFYIWPEEDQTSELGIYLRQYSSLDGEDEQNPSFENFIIYSNVEDYSYHPKKSKAPQEQGLP